jgi:hypothetical protein
VFSVPETPTSSAKTIQKDRRIIVEGAKIERKIRKEEKFPNFHIQPFRDHF